MISRHAARHMKAVGVGFVATEYGFQPKAVEEWYDWKLKQRRTPDDLPNRSNPSRLSKLPAGYKGYHIYGVYDTPEIAEQVANQLRRKGKVPWAVMLHGKYGIALKGKKNPTTFGGATRYEQFITRKKKEWGSKFDDSDLDHRFVPYFNSGERIKVEDFGETITGTVGVTTGWKPVFLLMRTKRSSGSSDILNKNTKILGTMRRRNPQSVYMVTPLTKKAKAWVNRNVGLESWQWMGPSFAVEWRYLNNLVEGMEDSGLERGKDFEVN